MVHFNNTLHGFTSPSELLCGRLDGELSSVLAAFSGGADSALMLFYLKKWCEENGVKLYAAHVNHGIRGEEAIRDREHCVDFCKNLGVKLFLLDFDVPAFAKETKTGLEEAARRVRYDFFAKTMRENGIPVLATAHNADDNLETVLFRLARGTGTMGICGIPPVRALEGGGLVIRPVLSMTKKEILDICDENGIKYVYDSSNSDTAYTRNGIRANLLPHLRTINPNVSAAVLRTSLLEREDEEYFAEITDEYLKREDALSILALMELKRPVLMRVLARLCEGGMPEHVHLSALYELVSTGGEGKAVSLPGKIKAEIKAGRLVFSADERKAKKSNDDAEPFEVKLDEGDNFLPGGYVVNITRGLYTPHSHCTREIQPKSENVYKLFTQAVILSDKINGYLFAGNRKKGEKIRTCGMGKDLRKLMSSAPVPLCERPLYPVIRDCEGALILPGIAMRDGISQNKNQINETLSVITVTVSKREV